MSDTSDTNVFTATDQARWFVACIAGDTEPTDDDIRHRVTTELLQAVPPAAWRSRFSVIAQSAQLTGPPNIDDDSFRLALTTPPPTSHRAEVECRLDTSGRISAINDVSADTTGLHITAATTDDLSPTDRDDIYALFDQCYRTANHNYLATQIATLRNAATIRTDDNDLVGFALGETRHVDLPRLPDQAISLAGLACIHPEYRRRGLFLTVENTALRHQADTAEQSTMLLAGRVAHPASLRAFTAMPSAVPRPGQQPTPWQQQIGTAVANLYRAHHFDAETFTCKGDGTPIGEPVIDIDATADEWNRFAAIDRNRGDSLLVLAWTPHAPDEWNTASGDG